MADPPELGRPMAFDHRRILATAMGRLRGKLKDRPGCSSCCCRLHPARSAEDGGGDLRHALHKQNFRRLVEQGGLVETTGNVSTETGGRPASFIASAAKWCWSGLHQAFGSNPAAPRLEVTSRRGSEPPPYRRVNLNDRPRALTSKGKPVEGLTCRSACWRPR